MPRQRTLPHLKENRRSLRAEMTKPEQLLWAVIRNRRLDGLKFRRQHSIEDYIADFACTDHQLVVELDGGYHDMIVERDLVRQARLEELGWRVVRFWNEDVLENVEVITRAIRNVICEQTSEAATPHPNPLPLKGERGQSQGGRA